VDNQNKQLVVYGSYSGKINSFTVDGQATDGFSGGLFSATVPMVAGMVSVKIVASEGGGGTQTDTFDLPFNVGCEVGANSAPDTDCDTVADATDLCPNTPDQQADLDKDGIGDLCDPDADGGGKGDVYVTGTIGAAGGSLMVSSGPYAGATLTVPPGALTTDTTISITANITPPATGGDQLSQQAKVRMFKDIVKRNGGDPFGATLEWIRNLADGFRNIRPVLDFKPDGLAFAKPAIFKVPYLKQELETGVNPATLAMYRHNGTNWDRLPSTVDRATQTMTIEMDHFSDHSIQAALKSLQSLTVSDVWNRFVKPVITNYTNWDKFWQSEQEKARLLGAKDSFAQELKDAVAGVHPCEAKNSAVLPPNFPKVKFILDLMHASHSEDPAVIDPRNIRSDLVAWVAKQPSEHPNEKIKYGDMIKEALRLTKGDVFSSLQTCHGLTRDWRTTESGAAGNIGSVHGTVFVKDHFQDVMGLLANYSSLNKTDYGGAVYHMFGVAAYVAYERLSLDTPIAKPAGYLAGLLQELISPMLEALYDWGDLFADFGGADLGDALMDVAKTDCVTTVTGMVTQCGSPISGATVTITLADYSGYSNTFMTGGDGKFSEANVPADKGSITAKASYGGATGSSAATKPHNVSLGLTDLGVIELPCGTTVQGKVTVNGAPTAGVAVKVTLADLVHFDPITNTFTYFTAYGTTGGDGGFSIGGVPVNEGNITVEATYDGQSKTAGPTAPVPGGVADVGTIDFPCPDMAWGSNPQTIVRNGSVTISVTGGKAPYVWNVAGNGFSLASGTTNVPTNTLVADGTACGAATVTVTACNGGGKPIAGYVRNDMFGKWALKSKTCVLSGPPTGTNGGYNDQLWKIEGNKKQQQWLTVSQSTNSSKCLSENFCNGDYCAESSFLNTSGYQSQGPCLVIGSVVSKYYGKCDLTPGGINDPPWLCRCNSTSDLKYSEWECCGANDPYWMCSQ
jgi:hypothetical protein